MKIFLTILGVLMLSEGLLIAVCPQRYIGWMGRLLRGLRGMFEEESMFAFRLLGLLEILIGLWMFFLAGGH